MAPHLVVLAAAMLASACSGPTHSTPGAAEEQVAAGDTRSLPQLPSDASVAETLAEFTQEGEEIIKTAASSEKPGTALMVGYFAAEASRGARCIVRIIDLGARTVQESSAKLLDCSNAASAEIAAAAISARVSTGSIVLDQTGAARESSFVLVREGEHWLVKQARFSYAQQDQETGDLIAVEEILPGDAFPTMRMSAYTYTAIEPKLQKQLIR